MSSDNKGWYILRTVSGKENKVEELLTAQAKNTDLGNHLYRILVPTEKVTTTRGGKKVVKDRILLTGYVFVECNLTGEVEFILKNTTNVKDFLRAKDSLDRAGQQNLKPVRLTQAEVEKMVGGREEKVTVDSSVEYHVGEAVKVKFGAFNGCKGTVSEVNPEKHKLKVEVKIFGRPTEVELDNSQVEKE